MDLDSQWIITVIDGKIASASTNYRQFAAIADKLAGMSAEKIGEIRCYKTSFKEIWRLRQEAKWDDFILFGTEFQKKVWKCMFEMGHNGKERTAKLVSYSDFAEMCGNKAGVRAAAHAIGLNPIAVVIPCHLVIPKESADWIRDMERGAEVTLFKGDDLIVPDSLDFGEYALGKNLKRDLIKMELAY